MQSPENESQADIAQSLQQALQALNSGDHGAAEIFFQQTLMRAGNHPSASRICLGHLSTIRQERGDYDEAIRFSLRALNLTKEINGDGSEPVVSAMVQLAEMYNILGRYDEAGDLYYRAKVMSDKLIFGTTDENSEVTLSGQSEDEAMPEMSDRLRNALEKNRAHGEEAEPNPEAAPPKVIRSVLSEEERLSFLPGATHTDADKETTFRHKQVSDEDLSQSPPPSGKRSRKRVDDDDTGSLLKSFAPDAHTPAQGYRSFSAGDVEEWSQTDTRGARPGADKSGAGFRDPEQTGGHRAHSSSDHNSSSSTGQSSSVRSNKLRLEKTDDANATAEWNKLLQSVEQTVNLRQLTWLCTQFLRDKRNLIAASCGFLVFMLILIGWACTLPQKKPPLEAYLSMPHHYRSVDGDVKVDLPQANQCDLTMGDSTLHVPMALYLGDWREGVLMAVSSLYSRQISFRLVESELVGEQGSMFYPMSGQVSKLLAEMELIESGATDLYAQYKRYPARLGELRGAKTFENAFTNRTEAPTIQALELPTSETGPEAKDKLMDLCRTLYRGGSWSKETPLKPGAINCCAVTAPYRDGYISAFLVQAADESGAPLMGVHPGTSYYIALADGDPVESLDNTTALTSSVAVRPRLVWINQSTDSSFKLYLLQHTGAFIFLIVSLALFGVILLIKSLNHQTKTTLTIICTLCLFIAGIYFMEALLP